MRALLVVVATAGLVGTLGSARADKLTAAESKARAFVDEVGKAAEARDGEKGAKALVELTTLATKEKSPSIEERAAESLERLLDALRDVRPPGGTTEQAGPREVLATVMKALDPARHGLFVSAHALANELVLRAAEQGDSAHLDAALTVATAYAGSPKCGKAGPAMLKLAQGLKAARANDAKAGAALEAAAAALKEGRWTRPALACALERIALLVGAGDAAGAAKVAQEVVAGLSPEADTDLVRTWSQTVRKRLPGLPDALTSALDAALGPFSKAGAGAAGGRGGHGGSPGGDVSPLGRSWSRLGADKAFVTVQRDDGGYDIRLAHDKKLVDTKAFEGGQRNWDRDGVSMLFCDGSVALRMLDMAGTRGQPGERSEPSAAWAWYPLAPGETYQATKSGVQVAGS